MSDSPKVEAEAVVEVFFFQKQSPRIRWLVEDELEPILLIHWASVSYSL